MRGVFNGIPVRSAQDLVNASLGGNLRLRQICGEPKRYIYRDMGKLAYSVETAAEWFAAQLGIETIADVDAIREEMI